MRKTIIAANWKMNKTISDTKIFFNKFEKGIKKINGKMNDTNRTNVIICPSFSSLETCKRRISKIRDVSVDNKLSISLGAQDMYFEDKGAFTGEISASMIKDVGCSYVIIGHSERRHVFGEKDSEINKKVKKAIFEKLIPILCVGETLEERKTKKTKKTILNQISKGFKNLKTINPTKVIIAYEPVWAIGTGKNATPKQANDVHEIIREKISQMYDKNTAEKISILYGGSINANNSKLLFNMKHIDGGLIGGASLDAKEFLNIIYSVN